MNNVSQEISNIILNSSNLLGNLNNNPNTLNPSNIAPITYKVIDFHLSFKASILIALIVILLAELGDKTFIMLQILQLKTNKITISSASLIALLLINLLAVLIGFLTRILLYKNLIDTICLMFFFVYGLVLIVRFFNAKERVFSFEEELENAKKNHMRSSVLMENPIQEMENNNKFHSSKSCNYAESKYNVSYNLLTTITEQSNEDQYGPSRFGSFASISNEGLLNGRLIQSADNKNNDFEEEEENNKNYNKVKNQVKNYHRVRDCSFKLKTPNKFKLLFNNSINNNNNDNESEDKKKWENDINKKNNSNLLNINTNVKKINPSSSPYQKPQKSFNRNNKIIQQSSKYNNNNNSGGGNNSFNNLTDINIDKNASLTFSNPNHSFNSGETRERRTHTVTFRRGKRAKLGMLSDFVIEEEENEGNEEEKRESGLEDEYDNGNNEKKENENDKEKKDNNNKEDMKFNENDEIYDEEKKENDLNYEKEGKEYIDNDLEANLIDKSDKEDNDIENKEDDNDNNDGNDGSETSSFNSDLSPDKILSRQAELLEQRETIDNSAFSTIFLSMIVSECGDRSQLCVFLMSALLNAGGVIVGSSCAFIISTLIGVYVGGKILKILKVSVLNLLLGMVLIGFAWQIYQKKRNLANTYI